MVPYHSRNGCTPLYLRCLLLPEAIPVQRSLPLNDVVQQVAQVQHRRSPFLQRQEKQKSSIHLRLDTGGVDNMSFSSNTSQAGLARAIPSAASSTGMIHRGESLLQGLCFRHSHDATSKLPTLTTAKAAPHPARTRHGEASSPMINAKKQLFAYCTRGLQE